MDLSDHSSNKHQYSWVTKIYKFTNRKVKSSGEMDKRLGQQLTEEKIHIPSQHMATVTQREAKKWSHWQKSGISGIFGGSKNVGERTFSNSADEGMNHYKIS